MKLSARTMNLLKNFSTINGNFTASAGNRIKTIAEQKNVFADAVIEESFPVDVYIYDLSQFLSAASMFASPEFDFQENRVVISENGRSVNYLYADPSHLTKVPSKEVQPSADAVDVNVTADAFGQVLKAASVLQLPDVAFVSDGESNVRLIATNSKLNADACNQFSVDLETKTTAKFKLLFKAENLKMISGDYVVKLVKGPAFFYSTDTKNPLHYLVSGDASSTFTA